MHKYWAWLQRLDLHGTGAIVAALLVWQVLASGLVNPYFVSSPAAVAASIAGSVLDGTLWPNLASTLTTTLIGFVAAAALGVGLAMLLGLSRFLERTFAPLIFIAFCMPKVALAPLLLLWVGVGKPSAICLAFITSFFMVFFNAFDGIRRVPAAYLDAAAVMGASRWQAAFKIRLPAAAPFVASGLHQGLIYAFHGAILGEMTTSNTGIGYMVAYAATSMDSTGVIAGLLTIGAVSYALVRLMALLSQAGGLAALPEERAA